MKKLRGRRMRKEGRSENKRRKGSKKKEIGKEMKKLRGRRVKMEGRGEDERRRSGRK